VKKRINIRKKNGFWLLGIILVVMSVFYLGNKAINYSEPARDDVVQAKHEITRENWEEHFGIIDPEPGTYPVTIYSNEAVPLPVWYSSFSNNFHWFDDDTLIYVTKNPDYKKEVDGETWKYILIKFALSYAEREKLTELPHPDFCYDSITRKTFYTTKDLEERKIVFKHGKWNEPLETFRNLSEPAKKVYQNYDDCSFHVEPDNGIIYTDPLFALRDRDQATVGLLPLREGDGYLGHKRYEVSRRASLTQPGLEEVRYDNTTFYYMSPEGDIKKFKFGYRWPHLAYDHTADEYTLMDIRDDGQTEIRRFDDRFNLVSEKVYPDGPWSNMRQQVPVKDGYLINQPYYDYNYLFLLTHDGRVIKVLKDFGLAKGVSVSPSGCKVAFMHVEATDPANGYSGKSPRSIGVLELCKS